MSWVRRREYSREVEVTVLGGLPLTAWYNIAGPEPDVGLPFPWIDDWCLVDGRGRQATWAEGRMTEKDVEELFTELLSTDQWRLRL